MRPKNINKLIARAERKAVMKFDLEIENRDLKQRIARLEDTLQQYKVIIRDLNYSFAEARGIKAIRIEYADNSIKEVQ